MNILKTIANLISKPTVNPAIRIADEAFKLSPGSAPSAAEVAKIKKIADQFNNAVQILNNHSDVFLKEKSTELHKQYSQAVRSGGMNTIKVDGMATMQSEFEMKRILAREQMDQLRAEGVAMAAPIYKRTITAVEAFAEQRERYEIG